MLRKLQLCEGKLSLASGSRVEPCDAIVLQCFIAKASLGILIIRYTLLRWQHFEGHH